MISTNTIAIITLVVACGGVVFLGLILCVLLQMGKEEKTRGDTIVAKADEVKDTVAKDATLQAMKDKS